MTECLIAFGANLAKPKVTFHLALSALRARGFVLRRKSGLWHSPAWPEGSDQPNYVNAVVSGLYEGTAEELMTTLLQIETLYGRVRSEKNAPRTLDLDLLTFGREKHRTEYLTVPHPRMLERAFVLIPASEIDNKWLRYLRQLPQSDIQKTQYISQW